MTLSRLRNAFSTLARGEAVPELPAMVLGRARVVSVGPDRRLSLQRVDRAGEYPDLFDGRVPLWCGTAGVSVEPTPGQEVIFGFSEADFADPITFMAAPFGEAGHAPVKVWHEATTEIRFVSAAQSALGVVRIGPGATLPVALGPALDAVIAALQTFASAAALSTDPVLAAAATALQSALGAITITSATKLEAI